MSRLSALWSSCASIVGETGTLRLRAPGGSMSVRRLSAIADPVSLEPDAFQRLTAKTPYLIQAGGNVYFCSGKKVSVDKETFRSRLFSPVVAPEQKKGR